MGTKTRTKTTRTKTTRTKAAENILVFGLGSNLGDREVNLRHAVERLEEFCGPLAIAPFYSSYPLSPIPQAKYLNTVAIAPMPGHGHGVLGAARNLLEQIKQFERQAGRRPGARYGPRPLDIDLLLYGDLVHRDPEPPYTEALAASPLWLALPHPRMRQRRFVLAPLNDLAPDLELPPDGVTVHRLLENLGKDQVVTRLG